MKSYVRVKLLERKNNKQNLVNVKNMNKSQESNTQFHSTIPNLHTCHLKCHLTYQPEGGPPYVFPQRPKHHEEKPRTLLLIILTLVCTSDIIEVHVNLSDPLLKKKVRRRKHHGLVD